MSATTDRPVGEGENVLEVSGIGKRFGSVEVLRDVSLSIGRGRTVSLVGESGSGKTTLARIIIGLETADRGQVRFPVGGGVRRRRRRHGRGRVGVVLQDSYDSVDPRFTVGEVVAEPLRANGLWGPDGTDRVAELLEVVGMPGIGLDERPHRLSGGQLQRICIARALAMDPYLVVCDEPTSALDVSIQAQILNLLLRLQRERGLAYLFITHNIEIVRRISDEVVVLHDGRVVERGTSARVVGSPTDPYTRRLLAAVPGSSPHERRLECRARVDPRTDIEARRDIEARTDIEAETEVADVPK